MFKPIPLPLTVRCSNVSKMFDASESKFNEKLGFAAANPSPTVAPTAARAGNRVAAAADDDDDDDDDADRLACDAIVRRVLTLAVRTPIVRAKPRVRASRLMLV